MNKEGVYSEEEIKKLSEKYPEEVFTSSNGRVAHAGLLYKNEEEFKRIMKFAVNSPITIVFQFFDKLFSRSIRK